MEFLIVCPLALIAGLVDAVAGGGGLISLPAYFFAGLPPHTAIATNKLSSTMGTTVATVRYVLFGYMVKRFVLVGIACGLVGSAAGAQLALVADSFALMVFMLVSLPFVAGMVFRTRDLNRFAERPLPPRRALALTGALALAVGVYDGFYGPGTGTILMLLLTAVAHQGMREAAGTTKAINLATNTAALVVFLVHGEVLIGLGLAAGLFNIAGNWIGTSLFDKKGAALLRPLMLVVIALFAVRLLVDLFG
ncbi:TSUP family transporter [Adlercreutzia equolifaciens]|uniref:sulfite exporter TauE/SafE family protein n=1 Tax=Adlercreutzia equolifaciens TaxID=446660 RepID=UPI0023B01333|nr:TSUP family transporter [Adlercreutzia equolifaciens]MDE8702532.1 TSUP family transporter [Adlercreutzia equolifaciens]